MTFPVEQQDNEEECLANAKLVSLHARRFGKGQWAFIGPGSEKKRYCISEDSPQGVWDNITEKDVGWIRRKRMSNFSVLRAHCPEVNSKAKDMEKLSIHYATDLETVETIFRIIVSANQFSLYGAVAEICEEFESLHERTGRPVVGGSPHSCSVWSRQKFLWTVMTRWIMIFHCSNMEKELKSCHNKTNWVNLYGCRISECCWNWTMLQNERHCRSLNNFMQWPVVNTLFQEKKTSITTKWMDPREHQNWGPY